MISIQKIIIVIWEKLQFGFDIVIPIVAVWIFVKWVRESRKRSIDVTLKSALLNYLLSLIHSLSEKFVKNLVESCLQCERKIDYLMKVSKGEDGDVKWESLAELISDDDIKKELEKARAAHVIIDDFYNTVQSYRYSIYPLLRTLGAAEYIAQFEKEAGEILEMYNEISSSINTIGIKLDEGQKIDALKFLALLSGELQKTRIECKEVCSFLSALVEQVLTQSSGEDFQKLILEYKEILKTKQTIR